jgi:hypothetical protein
LTLAERSILPDVAFDVQQAAQYLDHTAWSAITVAEAEISAFACARLASRGDDAGSVTLRSAVGLTLRTLEGALHYGRPSFGARDAAWVISSQTGTGDDAGPPDLPTVYEAVLDAILHHAPAAEEAARSAAHAMLEEAAVLAAQHDSRAPLLVPEPSPIPPLAFRGLADLPHVAYVVDQSLRFAYVNRAWESFAAQNNGQACLPSSVVGQSWIDSIGGPDREHWLSIAEQMLAG